MRLIRQVPRRLSSTIAIASLAGFLLVDISIIVADVVSSYKKYTGEIEYRNPSLSVTADFGYGERFNYLKETMIGLMMLILYIHFRRIAYLALSILFLLILLDDSLQFHENAGYWIAEAASLQPVGGLEAQNIGELIYWAFLGSIVAAALAAAFSYSSGAARSITATILILVALLTFFGIVADTLRSKFGTLARELDFVLGLIEDGGEMVILSVICAVSLDMVWRGLPLKSLKRSSNVAEQGEPSHPRLTSPKD